MKNLIIPLLLTITSVVFAQTKPKQHVYYDTVKTVETRVDYSPDTIPVYFKELIFGKIKVYDIYNPTAEGPKTSTPRDSIYIIESWQKGFVVWQTYHKGGVFSTLTGTAGTNTYFSLNSPGTDAFYKTEYDDFTKTAPGIFLYNDRKTRVTNKVLSVIKQ